MFFFFSCPSHKHATTEEMHCGPSDAVDVSTQTLCHRPCPTFHLRFPILTQKLGRHGFRLRRGHLDPGSVLIVSLLLGRALSLFSFLALPAAFVKHTPQLNK